MVFGSFLRRFSPRSKVTGNALRSCDERLLECCFLSQLSDVGWLSTKAAPGRSTPRSILPALQEPVSRTCFDILRSWRQHLPAINFCPQELAALDAESRAAATLRSTMICLCRSDRSARSNAGEVRRRFHKHLSLYQDITVKTDSYLDQNPALEFGSLVGR